MCQGCQMTAFGSSESDHDFEPFPTKDGKGYNGTGRRSPQWWPSRYGADDRIGSGNELTAERTLEAVRLVSEGRVIELSRILEKGVPIWPPEGVKPEFDGARPFHQSIVAHAQLEATMPPGNNMGYLEENVFKTYHIGTHIDGLAHVGIDGRYYNGVHYKDFYTPTGVKTLGMELTRPFVCRGVVLNIAKLLGVDMLLEGFVITPEHLEAACVAQGVEVRAGDVVIIHTGYGALWMVDNNRYGNLEPGIGWEAAHWLTDRRISAVGADNWSVEVLPGERPEAPFAVHQHLLAETGTHIIENMKTDELVACGKSEFLFVCLPIKHRGATGSQISPVAVI